MRVTFVVAACLAVTPALSTTARGGGRIVGGADAYPREFPRQETGCLEGMSAVMKERRWSYEEEQWQVNVVENVVYNDSIVDGMECCQMCTERYPETRAWSKFIDYNECTCISYSDYFDPLDEGLTTHHGAYWIGTCG